MNQPPNPSPEPCPVARPVVSTSPNASLLVEPPTEPDSAHDIVTDEPSVTHRAPTSQRFNQRLRTLAESLAPLDWQVVSAVARFRLLTGQQLQRRFFPDSPAAARASRRTLLRLTRANVLMRLERRIGGIRGGSSGYIYALGVEGQKLLHQGRRTRRYREPGWPFLKHTLAISELYVQLGQAAQSTTGLDLVTFDPEPLCWRSQAGSGSERLHLRPDAYVVVDRGRRRQFWFVEVDLGTESRPTLKKKMQHYVDWLETGVEQQQHSGVFPRVLWHSPDQQRRQVIQQLIEKTIDIEGLHVTDGLLEG